MSKTVFDLLIANHGSRTTSNVAITFDDGPNPHSTPKILDILRAQKCHATFFLIGKFAAEQPDMVKRLITEGHSVGGHSFSHGGENREEPSGNFRRGNEVIESIIGKPPRFIRVPRFGYTHHEPDGSPIIKELLEADFQSKINSRALSIIGCDVNPSDWSYEVTTNEIVERVLSRVQNGSIIDLHDGSQRRPQQKDRAQRTIEALPLLISGLRRKKLNPVGLDEMLLFYEQIRFEMV